MQALRGAGSIRHFGDRRLRSDGWRVSVFLALGGAAYAAAQLPKASVGSKQLKPSAVSTEKIKDGAVTGAKVKDGSLSAADLAPGTIPTAVACAKGPARERGPAGPGLEPATHIDGGLADGTGGCGTNNGFVNWKPESVEHVGFYRSPDGIVQLKGTAQQCSPFDGIVFTCRLSLRAPLPDAHPLERRRLIVGSNPLLPGSRSRGVLDELRDQWDTGFVPGPAPRAELEYRRLDRAEIRPRNARI